MVFPLMMVAVACPCCALPRNVDFAACLGRKCNLTDLDRALGGYHERRKSPRDTHPESYITVYLVYEELTASAPVGVKGVPADSGGGGVEGSSP